MATPTDDKDVFAFEKFLGLRNNVSEEHLDAGDLTAALNVDLTDAQRLRRRTGFDTPVFPSPAHSLWSDGTEAFFVSGTDLYRLHPDYSYGIVHSGLTAGRRVYYAPGPGRVYFSNGAENGVIEGAAVRTWGLAHPIAQPTASVIGGALAPGRYQYAVTYLRDNGQESGTGRAGVVELTETGGIRFDLIPVPTDPSVVSKRLYVSPTNGDLLYQRMDLDTDEETATYVMTVGGTLALTTQFLSAPPPGEHLAAFAGRILMAVGSRLHVSEPYAHELFDPRRVYPFTGRITLVAPVEDGVYLGTESQIVWLPGKDPAAWDFRPVAAVGVIPGTLAYGDASDLGGEATGPAAFFASTDGVYVGLNSGAVRNLTADRFAYPAQQVGAGLVRKSRGSTQYLATLKGAAVNGNTAY